MSIEGGPSNPEGFRNPELEPSSGSRRSSDLYLLSPCCGERLWMELVMGLHVGTCSRCHNTVVRVNPVTGELEWVDNNYYLLQSSESLRPVTEADYRLYR